MWDISSENCLRQSVICRNFLQVIVKNFSRSSREFSSENWKKFLPHFCERFFREFFSNVSKIQSNHCLTWERNIICLNSQGLPNISLCVLKNAPCSCQEEDWYMERTFSHRWTILPESTKNRIIETKVVDRIGQDGIYRQAATTDWFIFRQLNLSADSKRNCRKKWFSDRYWDLLEFKGKKNVLWDEILKKVLPKSF